MNIVNLTPHALNIFYPDAGDPIVIAPSGDVARVSQAITPVAPLQVDGISIPVSIAAAGDVTGLPAPTPGTIYVVSGMVAAAAPRPDVFSPGDLVRNDAGQPIGCRGLRASVSP